MMVRKFTHQIWYITKNISELQIEYIDQASADYFMNGISIAQYKAFLVNIARIVVHLEDSFVYTAEKYLHTVISIKGFCTEACALIDVIFTKMINTAMASNNYINKVFTDKILDTMMTEITVASETVKLDKKGSNDKIDLLNEYLLHYILTLVSTYKRKLTDNYISLYQSICIM